MFPTAKQLIIQSVDLYKQHAVVILKYVLLTVLPTVVLIPFAGFTGIITYLSKQNSGPMMASLVVVAILAFAALMILSIWFSVALTRVVNKLFLAESIGTVRTELRDAKHVLLNAIGVSLLAGLYAAWPLIVALVGWLILRAATLVTTVNEQFFTFLSIFFALLGIYGVIHMIIYALRLAFSYYEVILKGVAVRESIKTSIALVRGRWWAIFWRFFAPVLLLWLILGTTQLLFGAIDALIDHAFASGILAFFFLVIQYLLSPVIMIVGIILYHQVKQTPQSAPSPSEEQS